MLGLAEATAPLGGSASAHHPGSSRLPPAAGPGAEITLHPNSNRAWVGGSVLCSRPSLTGRASRTGAWLGSEQRGHPGSVLQGTHCRGEGLWLRSPKGGLGRVKAGPAALGPAPTVQLASQCHGPAQPATLPGRSDRQPIPPTRGTEAAWWRHGRGPQPPLSRRAGLAQAAPWESHRQGGLTAHPGDCCVSEALLSGLVQSPQQPQGGVPL